MCSDMYSDQTSNTYFDYIFSYFDNISLILKIYLKTYLKKPAPEHIPLENIPENIFFEIDTRNAYFFLLKTYFPKSENIHRNMCSGMLSDLQICYQKIPPICYRICVPVLCVRHMLSFYVFQRYVFGICYRFYSRYVIEYVFQRYVFGICYRFMCSSAANQKILKTKSNYMCSQYVIKYVIELVFTICIQDMYSSMKIKKMT